MKALYPVPQNAWQVSARMNPVPTAPQENDAFPIHHGWNGVNGQNYTEAKHLKAANVSPWYGVYSKGIAALVVSGVLAWAVGFAGTTPAAGQAIPVVDVVIGNNFGHLPMFVGVDKGFFKKHGVDVRLKVVSTGSEMVSAMQKREVQIGDMSVTTFLKARHAGDPFRVIALIMNDATRANADEPLAIVARKGSGIRSIEDLKGKRVGLAQAQTSDEYLKMVLSRRGMKYEDVNIENIMSPPALGPALKDGKVEAVVSWEPYNTVVLEGVPDSYIVLRGGGHLSYIMVATAHEPTVQSNPQIIRNFVAGLAAASQHTRKNRNEAVEIFGKWVPNVDLAVAKKAVQHISYDPRISRSVLQAFEAAEDDILKLTLKDALRLNIPEQFASSFLTEVQKAHPEYFNDLPPLPGESR
jgi:ABC-type nitrate/sulfonate/bicarbonate transport system substrate-binding protein